MSNRWYLWIADAVLCIHFAFVAFVVVGLVLIWAGFFLRWECVRNFWFRVAHLLCMAVVFAESVLGVTCPLTTWEMKLRLRAGGGEVYQGSFIQHWIHKIMFFRLDEWVFTAIYAIVFGAIAVSLWVVRPRWPKC
jgi:hypothetical protein